MYIAYVSPGPRIAIKKPTRKQKIEALAQHLMSKWKRDNAAKADHWWEGLTEEEQIALMATVNKTN